MSTIFQVNLYMIYIKIDINDLGGQALRNNNLGFESGSSPAHGKLCQALGGLTTQEALYLESRPDMPSARTSWRGFSILRKKYFPLL